MIEKLAAKGRAKREWGNTFVFYMLMFPALFICFALASDIGIAQYTKTTLQADLDSAAQSAVGQSLPSSNSAANIAVIQNDFNQVYSEDRANYSGEKNTPFVLCQGSEIPFDSSPGINYTPADGCGWHENNFTYQTTKAQAGITYRNYVTITVTEYSKTMFLGIIGIDHFKYQLTTTAHLANSAYATTG